MMTVACTPPRGFFLWSVRFGSCVGFLFFLRLRPSGGPRGGPAGSMMQHGAAQNRIPVGCDSRFVICEHVEPTKHTSHVQPTCREIILALFRLFFFALPLLPSHFWRDIPNPRKKGRPTDFHAELEHINIREAPGAVMFDLEL